MHVMKRFRLSRRTMLRGVVGGSVVALALPPLEAMLDAHGEAQDDDKGADQVGKQIGESLEDGVFED